MKKTTRIILSVCLAVLFVVGVGGYAFVSDSYHADETAWEAMACQTDSVQAELDGNVTWFVPEDPTAGLIFHPGGKAENTLFMRLFSEKNCPCRQGRAAFWDMRFYQIRAYPWQYCPDWDFAI